jgi:hypothetical protein
VHKSEFDAHAVTIAVEDSGTGIAPSYVDRIFDPFFTTLRRNPMVWEWVFRFVDQLLKSMAADCGFRRSVLMEQPFTFNCRPTPRITNIEPLAKLQ